MVDMDPDLIDFVKKLVVIKPEDRMTMQEAAEHPFITNRGVLPAVDISVTNSGEDRAQNA